MWNLHTHFPCLMAPELRLQKLQEVRVVVDAGLSFHKNGDWDTYCDSITKLMGMATAFNSLDEDLYNYTMDWVNTLSRFSLQRTAVDFPTWAIGQACTALRAAA